MKQSCLPEFTYPLFLQSKQFSEKSTVLISKITPSTHCLNMQLLSKGRFMFKCYFNPRRQEHSKEKRSLQKRFRSTDSRKKKVRLHLLIGKMDSKKNQNWLKHTKKTHTLQNSTGIKQWTVPKKQWSQSTEQNTFSSYYLSQSNFLLVYLEIVIKIKVSDSIPIFNFAQKKRSYR